MGGTWRLERSVSRNFKKASAILEASGLFVEDVTVEVIGRRHRGWSAASQNAYNGKSMTSSYNELFWVGLLLKGWKRSATTKMGKRLGGRVRKD